MEALKTEKTETGLTFQKNEPEKVSIFGAAKVKKPAAKAKEEKVAIEIKGLESKLLGIKSVRAELADLKTLDLGLSDEVKEIGREKFLELYKENKSKPESFLIKDGDGCVMIIPTDGYLGIKDEERANQLREEYGNDVVTIDEKYYFTPGVLERNQQAIEELIMDATTISTQDKENLLTKQVSYSITKGTIDRLLQYGNKMENIFRDIQPTFQLKLCGDKYKDGGELLIDNSAPILSGYSLCHYAPVYNGSHFCPVCGQQTVIASESELHNELAEMSNEGEGSEEVEQRWEARGYDRMANGGGVANKWPIAFFGNVVTWWDPFYAVFKDGEIKVFVKTNVGKSGHKFVIDAKGDADANFLVKQLHEGASAGKKWMDATVVDKNHHGYYFLKTNHGSGRASSEEIGKNEKRAHRILEIRKLGASFEKEKYALGGRGKRSSYTTYEKPYEIEVDHEIYTGDYHFEDNRLNLDSCTAWSDAAGSDIDVQDNIILNKVYEALEKDRSDELQEHQYSDDEYAAGGGVDRKKLSEEEKQFIREEAQESGQGYTYRAKVLQGQQVVLKEKGNRPIQKWTVDNYFIAKTIADKLNHLQTHTLAGFHETGGYMTDPEYIELNAEYHKLLEEHKSVGKFSSRARMIESELERIQQKKKRIALGDSFATYSSGPVESGNRSKMSVSARFDNGGKLDLYAHWNKEAQKMLVGKTVKAASFMTRAEADVLGWYGGAWESCLIIEFTDGTIIYASSDDEGNDAGFMVLETDGTNNGYSHLMQCLSGAIVVHAEYMKPDEIEESGWGFAPVAIYLEKQFSSGRKYLFTIFPQRDPEGNDGGALFGQSNGKEFVLPVL